MKLVITDNDFDDFSIEQGLADEAGVELVGFHGSTTQEIVNHTKGADGILTSYGDYGAETINRLSGGVKVISRTGTGYDNIDVAAATARGIAVCNVNGYGTEVVSDHTIALALDCLRGVSVTDRSLRAGTWSYQAARPLGQVRGRTFGVVGMGNIGTAVARKALGLGFKVVCASHSIAAGTQREVLLSTGGTELIDVLTFDDLLQQCDVLSFHVALVPATRHLLSNEKITLMKPDAVVVNCSRGAVCDTLAIAQALEDGRLGGAGLDVFEQEPVSPEHPIFSAPCTVLTPHAAYWSEESGLELRTRTFENALAVLQGRMPQDILNPQVLI
jgi:D-3-phosphoglycerate dehydrogenase